MTQPIVISLHGIRTRGAWQKELTRALNDAGYVHEPLDFGFFRLLGLFLPSTRKRQVEWFRDHYTRIARDSRGHPHVIAHSFGTYLACTALERYPQVKFDRLILCGSIVRPAFPWSIIARERGQVSRVLNEHGRLDTWSKLVGWGVADAGPSGVSGFRDDGDGAVVQRLHPQFGHSDYFYRLNYEQSWIPFLQGENPSQTHLECAQVPNWRFRASVSAALLLLCALAASQLDWKRFRTLESNIQPTYPAESSTTHESSNLAPPVPAEQAPGVRWSISVEPLVQGVELNEVPPNFGAVVIDALVACNLRVSGEELGAIPSARRVRVVLHGGTHRFSCVDAEGVGYGQDLVVEPGQTQEIRISNDKRTPRFSISDSGSLIDLQTGVRWRATDNGEAINWSGATEFCKSVGDAWVLPNATTLLTLFDPGDPDRIACGPSTCKVSKHLALTAPRFWAGEMMIGGTGEISARGVDLADGIVFSESLNSSEMRRVLCVSR